MGTSTSSDALSAVLFGRTRRAVLALLFTHPEKRFHLRAIAREAGTGMGSVQRELKLLSGAGILRREKSGSQVYFSVNPDCPVFEELKGLVLKTVGVAGTISAALNALKGVEVALIYGSYARGDESATSDVDILVIGSVGFGEVVEALFAARALLKRELNPAVMSAGEFREKVKQGGSFILSLLSGEKLFLKGEKDELERLAGLGLD